MAMTIEHIRVSWIRALSLPLLVGATVVPGPKVSTVQGYVDAFEAARRRDASWRLPWAADSSFKLWKRNAGRINYRRVEAKTGWERMVPLWSEAPTAIRWCGGGEGSAATDRYLLPGAVAVVITVDFTGSFDFASALAAVIAAQKEKVYEIGDDRTVRLSQLYDRLLAECQQELLGELDPRAYGDTDPLAIVSVLGASGSAKDTAVEPDNAVHRLLYGFCAFDRYALNRPVTEPLTQSALSLSARSGGATLLAFHRGRAFWSPSKMFSPQAQAQLSCYHHNLVVSSAITESLLAFIANDHARLNGQAGFDISKLAAKVLGWLYSPAKDMWSSTSIRRQIDDSGVVETINEIRWQHAWKKLAAQTPTP